MDRAFWEYLKMTSCKEGVREIMLPYVVLMVQPKEPVDKVVPTGAKNLGLKKSLGSPNFLLPMMSWTPLEFSLKFEMA